MKEQKEEKKEEKRERFYVKRAAAFLFLGVVAFFCILNLAMRNYKSETVPGKVIFAPVKTRIDTFLGQRKSDGVLLGKEHYLFEEIAALDEKGLEENLTAMEHFRKNYPNIDFYLMLVPNAANILKDKLPSLAVTEDQTEQFKKIRDRLSGEMAWVDMESVLKKKKDEDIYYHTDSRWTTLGAYYGYQELAGAMQLDTSKAPELSPYPVTGNFNGDLSARSGYERTYGEPIYVYSAKEEEQAPEFIVNYVEEGKRTTALYDSSKLDKGDSYELFLGGDFPMINIQTTAENTDRLMIIKDSYANCLIPFLIPYYRNIIVIDPAYYSGDINKVMEEQKITSVLFLYNGNTFMEDADISRVLTDGKAE